MSAAHVAFVAGATGYTGREVVRELRARGIETIAHVRPDSLALTRWRGEFEALGARVDTTPWDEAAMRATFDAFRPTLVFALIGTTRARAARAAKSSARSAAVSAAPSAAISAARSAAMFAARSAAISAARSAAMFAARSTEPDSYETVDYALSSLLIRVAAAAVPAARLVYLSAAGTRTGTRNPYLAVRVRVERELVESGLAFTIARPAFVSGSDRLESRPAERVGAIVGDAALALLGALGARQFQRRWSSITGTELARGLVRTALDPHAVSRTLTGEDLRSSQLSRSLTASAN